MDEWYSRHSYKAKVSPIDLTLNEESGCLNYRDIGENACVMAGVIKQYVLLQSDRARAVASIFADISVKWRLPDLIQWWTDVRNFGLTDCVVYISQWFLFMLPNEEVSCQLRFPMLNDVMQAAPTREKPSPATARRDQMMQTRRKACRRRVI